MGSILKKKNKEKNKKNNEFMGLDLSQAKTIMFGKFTPQKDILSGITVDVLEFFNNDKTDYSRFEFEVKKKEDEGFTLVAMRKLVFVTTKTTVHKAIFYQGHKEITEEVIARLMEKSMIYHKFRPDFVLPC